MRHVAEGSKWRGGRKRRNYNRVYKPEEWKEQVRNAVLKKRGGNRHLAGKDVQ